MRRLRLKFVLAFAAMLSGVTALPTESHAYPDQIIKVIVTFPPGGSADVVIRALEPIVSRELKQGFVIENRAGAGGNIGMAAVAQAKPDGYTIAVAPAGALTVNPHINRTLPFDPLKDIIPVTLLAKIPFVLVASEKVPATTARDVIALAKAKPGTMSIAHGGNSTAMHLTAALFAQKADVNVELVPYRGTAPATTDVLAGHVPLAVLDIPSSREFIRDGRLKALGVSAAERVSFLPGVPTLAEAALPGFDSVGWFGIVAPAGTPQDIIGKLNTAFVKALKDPAVIEKVRALGAEPAPTSPQEFAGFIRSEYDKWGKLVAEAGIKAE